MGNRGYGGNGGAGDASGDVLYPWMNQAQGMWNGFATLTNAVTSGFANAETAATTRQMADMQQMFGLAQQFSDCCCENRLGIANLGADIAREACADRAAVSDGIRDLLAANVASTQRIVDNDNANYRQIFDWLCNKELRDEQRENDRLRQQVATLELTASQNAQTAQILADNARQTTTLEQYLNPTPIPAYQVANPNCCQTFAGCGCGSF